MRLVRKPGYFRGYTATAPLKRGLDWLAIVLQPAFPWLHSHGPIEARSCSGSMSVIPIISVATQPRPH